MKMLTIAKITFQTLWNGKFENARERFGKLFSSIKIVNNIQHNNLHKKTPLWNHSKISQTPNFMAPLAMHR